MLSDVETDPADPRLAIERARIACTAFSSLESSVCPHEVAAKLFVSLNEMVRLADQLLAEKELFRSRLHRSTSFPIPESPGPTGNAAH